MSWVLEPCPVIRDFLMIVCFKMQLYPLPVFTFKYVCMQPSICALSNSLMHSPVHKQDGLVTRRVHCSSPKPAWTKAEAVLTRLDPQTQTPCSVLQPTLENKPAAQAAGTESFRWNSTNWQNSPIQQNCRNSWTNAMMQFWCPLRFRIS